MGFWFSALPASKDIIFLLDGCNVSLDGDASRTAWGGFAHVRAGSGGMVSKCSHGGGLACMGRGCMHVSLPFSLCKQEGTEASKGPTKRGQVQGLHGGGSKV